MTTTHAGRTRAGTAAYLRCYPTDVWQMRAHHELLSRHADGLGRPEPVMFVDNGCRSRASKPQLELLLAGAADGLFEVVLVPGPWVFSLDDAEAERIRTRLTAHGCVVLESERVRD